MNMATMAAEQENRTIEFIKEIEIAAPIEIAYEALLEQLGPNCVMMGDHAFPMAIEPWPGGRWYRDLGNNSGHLWGHVQVIKPPGLLEICGPMFMSYPVANHLQYRLTAEGSGTRLKLTHRGFGQIPSEFLENAPKGWAFIVDRIRQIAERMKSEGKKSMK
jgi:hypothetical protein